LLLFRKSDYVRSTYKKGQRDLRILSCISHFMTWNAQQEKWSPLSAIGSASSIHEKRLSFAKTCGKFLELSVQKSGLNCFSEDLSDPHNLRTVINIGPRIGSPSINGDARVATTMADPSSGFQLKWALKFMPMMSNG
jgi:hypothetical protein